jgi:hypothetical protein
VTSDLTTTGASDETAVASLRAVLDTEITAAAAAGTKLSMKALTVLAPQNDPFRVDTPKGHELGRWLGDAVARLDPDKRIHLRGLHYAISNAWHPYPKPDGTTYLNDDKNWEWLQGKCAKAARFLGYVPFERIFDKRAGAPIVREFSTPEPTPYLTFPLDVTLPDPGDVIPKLGVFEFEGVQPYHLVLYGEKSSLDETLAPIAREYKADLYLETGEISDSHLYEIAASAVDDGRPLVVLTFSDCDPAGWQMPISISRKLQALKVLLPGMPEFEVHRVTVTPNQVQEYGLPYTPLKDSEKRADSWQQETGVAQTETDALSEEARPGLLRQITIEAIKPFYDETLDRRVAEAKTSWIGEAIEVIDRDLDSARLSVLRAQAARKLTEMQQQIQELSDQLRIDVDDFDLPPIDVPRAVLDREPEIPLIDSRRPFADQCRRLIGSKSYRAEQS